jgi:multiple sugar transport system substrate-binding protein
VSRHSLRLMAAAVLVAGVAACTPGTSSGTGADAKAAKPQQLTMLYATAEADAAAVQALLPQFKQKFGFDLKMDTQPYDALQQKVFAESASSSSHYDIVIVDTPWAPALVRNLEPLNGYLSNKALNDQADIAVGDFIPKVFYDTAVYKAGDTVRHFPAETVTPDPVAIKNKGFETYGLPIQANVAIMAYRKDLFDNPAEKAAFRQQYGRDLAVPATLDEYKDVAKFFTRPAKKLYGTTVMAGVGDWATDDFKTLLAANGGDGHLVGDDLSLKFSTPEGVKALTYYKSLIDSKVVPPGSTAASWDEAASTFDSGLAATTINYHALALQPSVKGGQIGYAPVPKGVAAGPHFGTWMLSLNKFSKNKAWAYRAMTWLTAAEQQLAMTKQQLHPSRTSVYQKITAEKGDPVRTNYYDTLGRSLAVGVGRARLTNYTEVSHAVAVAVNEAATGKQDPQAALSKAASDVKRLLKQAGYKV